MGCETDIQYLRQARIVLNTVDEEAIPGGMASTNTGMSIRRFARNLATLLSGINGQSLAVINDEYEQVYKVRKIEASRQDGVVLTDSQGSISATFPSEALPRVIASNLDELRGRRRLGTPIDLNMNGHSGNINT